MSETNRAAIRMRILTVFAEVGVQDNALATAVASNLWPELEQIVTEARAAALNEAAEAIEVVNTPKYMGPKRDAYEDAARIVRNLANSPPP